MLNKDIPPELQTELDTINKEVEAVLAKRTAWMDAHMQDFSKFNVGDPVYDVRTGQFLGTVTRLYRYWKDKDPRYDTSMSVVIEYRQAGHSNVYDNSSHYAGTGPSFGTLEEARKHAEGAAEYLAWKARGEDWTELFK